MEALEKEKRLKNSVCIKKENKVIDGEIKEKRKEIREEKEEKK